MERNAGVREKPGLAAFHRCPHWDQTCNPGRCSVWESNG